MNCEQVSACLDLLMDGELNDDMRRELDAHGQGCPACAKAIRDTLQLKALLSEMEPEVAVPLPAQAAWRGAVREAAQRDRRRKLVRWIGSAAAAVVVLVGVTLAFNGGAGPRKDAAATRLSSEVAVVQEAAGEEALYGETDREEAAYEAEAPALRMAEAPVESAVIETDGAQALTDIAETTDAGVCAAVALGAPSAQVDVRVKDVDAACRQIIDLASEYEGEADEQRLGEGGANLYVTLDAANAADFLSAVAAMDLDGRPADMPGQDSGTIQILVTVARE